MKLEQLKILHRDLFENNTLIQIHANELKRWVIKNVGINAAAYRDVVNALIVTELISPGNKEQPLKSKLFGNLLYDGPRKPLSEDGQQTLTPEEEARAVMGDGGADV